MSVVPEVRLPIPFSSGFATSALAAVQKIAGPVYGTINHSVGDMYRIRRRRWSPRILYLTYVYCLWPPPS